MADEYYALREEVWPYGKLWGNREERKAVRTYLRIVWLEHNDDTRIVRSNTEHSVNNERNLILRWWWENRYQNEGKQYNTRGEHFGKWLYDQYIDANKISYPERKQRGRNA